MTEDVAKFRLDDLYNTEAVVTLPDGSEVVVRTLTEAEVNMRDLAATRVSGETGAKYEDKDSEEYKEYILPLDEIGRDGHIATVMGFATLSIRNDVQTEFPFRYIPFPEDATDDEKEETLRQRDEHEAKVRQQRSEVMSRRLVARRDELDELDDDELRRRAKNALIRAQKLNARIEEFNVLTVYTACRGEDGKPFFDEDVVRRHGKRDGLNDSVYQKLMSVYAEIDTADPWVLQKHS